MKKTLMARAWAIAKKAVKNFGGKVKEYLSQAMKMAWSELKELTVVVYRKKEDDYKNIYYNIAIGNLEEKKNKKEEVYYQGYTLKKGFRRFKDIVQTFKISYKELMNIDNTINFMSGGEYISSVE